MTALYRAIHLAMSVSLTLALALASGIAWAAESPAPPPKETENSGTVEVWITNTGKRYHRASCRYAKMKSNLKDAQARGLTPCKVCNP